MVTAYITKNMQQIQHRKKSITSKTPKLRPSFPITPASSNTSLVAVTLGSSSGSTPPPGTIHFSGLREDVTSSTLQRNRQSTKPGLLL